MNTSLKIARFVFFILLICSLSQSPISGASAGSTPKTADLVIGPYSVFVPMVAAPNFSIFGTTLHQPVVQSEMQVVQTAGLAWTRVSLEWALIEPANGVMNWSLASSAEQAILAASQAGIQSILLIEHTPGWAVKPGFSCGAIAENYFAEFANFAKEVVRKYSAQPYNVKFFELYNEPDAAGILGCWGDPADSSYYGGSYYGEFLKDVYPAMKTANSLAHVLVGGLLLDCDPVNPPADLRTGKAKDCTSSQFFEGILSSGAGSSFDGVSFHSYDYYGGLGLYNNPNWRSDRLTNGSSTLPKAAYLRSMMQAYGVASKPLFNTEYALFCSAVNTNECSGFSNQVETTKAYYIVQFMATAAADRYQAAIWYSIMGGRDNSLLNPDLTPLPAFNAYKFANQKLGNASYVRAVDDAVFTIHEFRKIGGQKVWVVWTRDNQSHVLSLPQTPNAMYRIGTNGNPITEAPNATMTLDQAPAIIEF